MEEDQEIIASADDLETPDVDDGSEADAPLPDEPHDPDDGGPGAPVPPPVPPGA